MKKVLFIIVLLTISLAFTYGQAAVGGWGRGIFVPLIMADGDPTAASMVSWGPGGTRMGFTVSGSSDNVGVQMDVVVDNGAVAVGDQQKIWVKPIEMLTISVGRILDDTLRGSASFCLFNWLRPDSITGDDLIFGRVGFNDPPNPVNFEVALTPVDGAYIFVALGGSLGGFDLQGWIWGGPTPAMENMFKYGQYGAGYDIAGIGLIRAQLFGMQPVVADDWFLINAAFKLTMIEGLMVDIGGWIPTNSDEAFMVARIALYANYVMDTLAIHFSGDITIGTEPAVGDAVHVYGVALAGEYGLADGPTIQADLRVRGDTADGSDMAISGLLAAKFSYSNGIFGIGLEVTTASYANWGSALVDKTDPTAPVFAIPIRLEYWF